MPTHSETKRLPHGPRQMYDLVADVERYPEFLPWTAAARIRSREERGAQTVLEADLVISFKVFRERFGSRVVLDPGALHIDTEYLDGPFRHLKSTWDFAPAPEGCEVSFHVDFEFRNAVLRRVAGLVFHEAMQRVVRAFEARARELYG